MSCSSRPPRPAGAIMTRRQSRCLWSGPAKATFPVRCLVVAGQLRGIVDSHNREGVEEGALFGRCTSA